MGLPAAAAEEEPGGQGEGGKGDGDGDEDAERAEAEGPREDPGQRNLAEPEEEEVEAGGRPGVAGAVEGGFEAHAGGVEGEAEADDPERAGGVAQDLRVAREEAGDKLAARTKRRPVAPRKIMLKRAARRTAASARSGFWAPRFWPTRVAPALARPHAGMSAKITTRMAIV